jgi:hypothetical protein
MNKNFGKNDMDMISFGFLIEFLNWHVIRTVGTLFHTHFHYTTEKSFSLCRLPFTDSVLFVTACFPVSCQY